MSTSGYLIIVWSHNKSSSYLNVDLLFSNQQLELNPWHLEGDASASLPLTQTHHQNLNKPVIQEDTQNWDLTQLHQYLENQILKALRKNPDTLNKSVMRSHNPYPLEINSLLTLFCQMGLDQSKHYSNIFCTYPVFHHTYHSKPHYASVTHHNSEIRYWSEAFTVPNSIVILRPVNYSTPRKSHLA